MRVSEVASVPIILRRILVERDRHELIASIAKPIRVKRNKIVKEGELERTISKARLIRPGCRCVLVLLDADDDCPAELGPDQPSFAAVFDLQKCRDKCPSFRKFNRDVLSVLNALLAG
ncbi:hypothetical protein J7M28_08015 [bacterium]|nr:hypothetical protein [bacterium]